VRLLIDMNLSPRWVSLLNSRGMEAVHWSSPGSANAPDVEIMAYASGNVRCADDDLDFGAILAATHGEKSSIIQIRSDDVRPEMIGTQVIAALLQMEPELEQGALLTVEPDRLRARVLPLRRRI
jgi:predicted nuclease of predicted toxin-antitoxin system